MKHLPILLLPLAALAAEPAVELEPVDSAPAWRISVGFRAAPEIKTSARVDARAAAAAAGGVLRPAARGGTSASISSGGGATSATTEDLGSATSGTTEGAALAAAGWADDKTRWNFDGGYIDMDDGAVPPVHGETQNWHFDSAADFVNGAIRARTPYDSTTTSRTRTTSTTETPGSSSTRRSSSLREEWGDGLGGSSDETAPGFELRLDRTVWEAGRFGLDLGLGWAWYGDIDAYAIRGRAYSAAATERRTTAEVPSGTRVTTAETTTSTRESGTVTTSIAQPEFTDPDDYVNNDGSMGGRVANVYDPQLPSGWQMPVLTISSDRFSTTVERNPSETSSSTTVSESDVIGPARTTSSSRTTRRTVEVRSEGTLSMQELRFGARPFWKATRWLSLRGDLGLLAIRSELETDTRLSMDGAQVARIRREDDDWTLGGYAGVALDLAATDALVFSIGAEARFPHKNLRFDDGVVSGSIALAEWSASVSVGWRF